MTGGGKPGSPGLSCPGSTILLVENGAKNMDWQRVFSFLRERLRENRTGIEIRRDIEKLKLKREEKDALIELELAEILKKKELRTIIKMMDRLGAKPAGAPPDEFLSRIQQARTMRERMREALKAAVDLDEERDLKQAFSAKIRAVLRGEK